MDTTATILIIAAVVIALVAIGLMVWMSQRKRSRSLQEQFGPEYRRTVAETGDRRKAEAELKHRQERVEALELRTLEPAELDRFRDEWGTVQARFVDDPSGAVSAADRLVQEVMAARGYPIATFDQRAADISVTHPELVTNYRSAHYVGNRVESGEADTEEMRNGFVAYRALFAELLHDAEPDQPPARRNTYREPSREPAHRRT
jgi:hypothetical protein